MTRRQLASLAGAAFLPAGSAPAQSASLTIRQVVERIQKTLAAAGVQWRTQTVDTFKAGNPDTPVRGISTAFMGTLDVLQRSVASGKNFVVSHEPTFWNHLDQTEELKDDPVFQAKMDFVRKHDLVVWRFHDHWHARKPDGIFVGFNRAMGWEKHLAGESLGVYLLPETTLAELARDMQRKLRTRTLRVIGDPNLKLTKVRLGSHALNNNMDALEQADVILVPEAREWETPEYVRDLVASGRAKGALIMAHEEFEEWGMEDCAVWLRTVVPGVPVEFIPSGEPFWSPA